MARRWSRMPWATWPPPATAWRRMNCSTCSRATCRCTHGSFGRVSICRRTWSAGRSNTAAAMRWGKQKDRRAQQEEEGAALAWLKEIRSSPEQLADFLSDVLPKADGPRLPVVLWSRLSFDLAPYLTERMVDGSPLLNFYHRELGDVATAVFLAGGKDQPYHARLADYFRFKADPAGDRSWTGNDRHGLSELPYHLTRAAQYEEVYETLTDFKFLEHKAAEVGVQERKDETGNLVKTYTGVLQLQDDFERALAAMPGEGDREPAAAGRR